MIDLTFRHLRRHWQIHAAVMVCLTLASALLVSLSGYSAATAARELSQTLALAPPAQRNLLITGSRHTFSEKLYEGLEDRLGEVLKERMVIRHVTLPEVVTQPATETTGQTREIALAEVYSFSHLPDHVRLVEGHMPVQVNLNEARGSWRPPPIEAVIGARAAEQSGYTIGDRVEASKGYHRLDIVGIIEPLDPQADVWGEDLRAFEVDFASAVDLDPTDPDAGPIPLPLIIAPASMRSVYPDVPIFVHQVVWRVTLNHHLITVDQAGPLCSDLINFQTQSGTVGARTSTGLIQLLGNYLARLSRVRMVLLLFTAQSIFFVLYTLTTLTSAVLDRSRVELATLSARGASVWQITGLFGLQNLLLALPAGLILGPALAQVLVHLRGWGTSIGAVTTIRMSPQAWLLSGLSAGLGWLALVLPVFMIARRSVSGSQDERARPAQLSAAHRRYLDLYLLAFGGLLYWQLNRSGSFVMRAVASRRLGDTPLADPLLLIGPSLLLIGAAMVFLRFVPFLLRLVAQLSQRLRGLVLPLGLSHLARDPLQSSRLVLLVSLTAGLLLFTRTFGAALDRGQDPRQPDALALGISTTLQLNALMMVLFSVTTFFLAHLFAAQSRRRSRQRASDFEILRALGLSDRQWLALLVTEGLLVLIVGLLAGSAVGLGLSRLMIPYLGVALADPLAGVTLGRIRLDWPTVTHAYALLAGVYGAALVLLTAVLGRPRARLAPRLGDE
jgi:hypothetical protein